MAKFTVRIELHSAEWADYDRMYEYLSKAGFTDEIQSATETYKMPPGEYNFQGEQTREQVMESAKACAAKAVNKFAVLVTESNGRSWYGLDKVE